jgi:pimeloyl-ACP methyl ester carboxylesterase
MSKLARCLIIVGYVALLMPFSMAQNPGGLPGSEHVQALDVLRHVDRVVVHGDVVHYRFDLIVGPGEYDRIRIHRVVKETKPYRPAKKMEGVLLLPGAPQLFEAIFMPPASPSVPAEEGSIALFLASNDIDVWGMDYGWSFVPYGTTDFTFLKGWGIAKDARHTEIALSIARWMRAASGQGIGPIHLLGFSYGGFLVYAVASEDTRLPGALKNVKGIIPVDGANFKAIPGSTGQINVCNSLPAIKANLDAGVYVTDSSDTMKLGQAALSAPDAPSVMIPPFNNYQAAQVRLVQSKFLGGSFTTSPPSVTLLYSDGQRVVDLMANTPPYIPYQWTYDSAASRCGSDAYPVTFDDHLGDITVPILYLARQEGGFYTTTLTSSNDVTKILVNPLLLPTLYGHADLFLANNAADTIWGPILEWLKAHR